jgi:uncharacterized protein (DUF952 family)
MILHITTHEEWEKAQKEGKYTTSSLNSDGYIHCSTLKQTVDTANIFFKGQSRLILLCIDEEKLTPEIKYEDPSVIGEHDPAVGMLFPHIYGPINNDAVVKVVDFPTAENGCFSLPDELLG